MKILNGIDLIYLPKFKKALKNGGENFLQRVYLTSELKNTNIEHLAGIFAAKEAVMKALNLPKDSWHDIRITNNKSGAPIVETTTVPAGRQDYELPTTNYALSISHNGQYVIAQFVVMLEKE